MFNNTLDHTSAERLSQIRYDTEKVGRFDTKKTLRQWYTNNVIESQ
jgi:hypothetical protein